MAATDRVQQERLSAAIAAAQRRLDESGLIAALSALVRIRSVHDPARDDGNEEAAANYVASLLDSWSMPYARRDVAPRRPNIVVDVHGGQPGPVLVLEGHTDVVTAGPSEAWSVDPFGADVRDGWMYGRGTVDMKGGLAAMLFAARAIRDSGARFPGTIRLAILADEEGLMLGAKAFVGDGYLDGATAAIICEPEGDRVCVAQKGAIRLSVTFRGHMAHGAMPEEGANPITALAEAIHACRALEREIQLETGEDPLLGKVYVTPTVAMGGEREQGNVIPERAELFLDVRTTYAVDHDTFIQRVDRVIESSVETVPGVTYDMQVIDNRPSTVTDRGDAIVKAAIEAHERATGNTPPFGGVPGSTDGTIFWAATRLPLVTWGPGSVTLPHQADERIDIAEVVRYARMYIDAALTYFALKELG